MTPDGALSDFLLARIAEDETAAQAATPGPWQSDGHNVELVAVDDSPGYEGLGLHMHVAHTHMTTGKAQQEWRNAAHIARWDPARIFAECEAKRRIVARLAAAERYAGTKSPTTEYAEGYDHGILDAARFLALPYADHPDYRDEWKP